MRSLTTYQPQVYSPLPPNTTDQQLVELWLHNRPTTTQEGYRIDIRAFFTFVQKPLREVNLADLQAFADDLTERRYKDATKDRRLKAVKSLLTFAAKTHYQPFNVGAAMRLPKVRRRLHERILSREEILSMFLCEKNLRNRLILRLLYYSGMRVSELCGLCWKDLYAGQHEAGVIAIYGKGSEERHVALKKEIYEELLSFRNGAAPDAPIFVSRGGGRGRKKSGEHLDKTQIERIVEQAATRAGIKKHVTPHFERHSHATHAVLNKAPAPVIQGTLGHKSLETTMLYFDINPEESSSFYL
ncbi:MAG: tyrosine-type recombinase/integrase [Ktedonobacteraceae bacterium]|nr:tyrosine-type recombinase/integrase [Ktedonobacteraceae bacterium]